MGWGDMVFAKGAVGRRPRAPPLRMIRSACVGAEVGIGPYEGMARSSVKRAVRDAGPYGVHGKGFGIWGITDCHDQ